MLCGKHIGIVRTKNEKANIMGESVIWVWNGWGFLFLFLFSLYLPANVIVVVRFGSGTPVRGVIRLSAMISLVLVFVFSGWIAGLVSIPLGIFMGLFLCGVLHHIGNRKEES